MLISGGDFKHLEDVATPENSDIDSCDSDSDTSFLSMSPVTSEDELCSGDEDPVSGSSSSEEDVCTSSPGGK